jgi:hypothetical protein
LLGNFFHLQLTAPLFVAPFRLIEVVPCTATVTDIFAVMASELACETLLMNKSRGASGVDGSEIGCLGFAVLILERKLFSL